MATLSQSTPAYTITPTTNNWLATYNTFIEEADFNRVGWAATTIIVQGCILTPAFLLIMFMYGGGDWQLLTANLSFLLVLVPVLSAMSVKYILPAFAFSTLLHLALILMDIL
ncbi:hypothetical protein [Spirosoma utsteinense]|uniref:Uncharacterized protein n=1 Tax=Spirosoma utsteinense TaxID=2585773 RepID=A0ABR6WA44_9BACT|nr:hypothetical protein [Spirosoma utsteinense]MBC3787966.1 hypothetical protein [Spirosoma utsteinense]MBC3793129.1 hypothetical protein [Spirosoma utsteinense]